MPLNTKQQEAVEYLNGPLLVLAGPGTGKTQLLSSKVAYILKNTDTNPENILCLAFTESGASNMRTRLTSMIGKAANKVNIHTYHAFGSDLIAQYKNYALEFDRNLDSAIDTVTQHKIIREIQSKLPANDILRNDATGDILETISNAKSARLSADDLAKIATDNIKTTAEMNPELNACLENLVPRMKFEDGLNLVYLPIMNVLAKYANNKPLAPGIEKEANFLLRELNETIESEKIKEKPSISALTAWKTKYFEKDEDDNFRLKNRIANKKLQSLAEIMRAYEKRLEKEGLYDFADMIQQAIKIIKEDSGFHATLCEKYQYILLDEFQDTNAAQAELIASISDYDQPNIMAVGDDDQAIFAFQGANVSNMLDFQNHYNAKVITLTDNYRSDSEILNLSYEIREQIGSSFAKQNGIIKRLKAFFKPSTAKIERHEFIEASAEYAWVTEQISKLIASGVKQSDIAVITPKHKFVQPLVAYLKSQDGINISYEKRDNVFEDARIHELIVLSRFAYEISQEKQPGHRLLEILSFPFFEVSPLSAIKAVNKAREDKKSALDYLADSEDEKLQQIAKFLADLAVKSFDTPIELFLDYLTGTAKLNDFRSPFLTFYAKNEDNYSTFELYENLSVLREALRKHSKKQVLKLKDFIEFLDDYEAAEQALVNTSPYQDSADAVQILTAHKSKGLEFEYVFLIAVDDRAWGNAKGNNNMLSLPKNLQQIRHTGTTEDECLRLFFVALTRAKSQLILTNSIKSFDDKTPARLEYLNEHEENDDIISPFMPSGKVEKHYDYTANDANLADLQTYWISNYQKLDSEIRPLLEQRMENYKLTATDLTTFIDVVYGGPATFYERKVLRAPDESYSESATFGNLIHATFEKVTNAKLDDTAALDFFREQVNSASIPDEDREYILEKGTESLKKSLQKFGTLLRDENAQAEVDLRHEHLSLDGIPLTGKVDHININHEAKTIEIYDFKTSGFKDNKWGSHPTLYKYMLQLGFYKLLLNLSPTYSKYRIEKAHILFVTPDKDDEAVHDKIYEYNQKDEAELIALIKSVYVHIKSLDYVENPDLFVTPDANKGIKEIREFISLLLDN